MKKLITVTALLFSFIGYSQSYDFRDKYNNDGSADMRYKSNRQYNNSPNYNTDGSPDMRYKSNQQIWGGTRLYKNEYD